jgi:hypothetical protein
LEESATSKEKMEGLENLTLELTKENLSGNQEKSRHTSVSI